MRKFLISAAVAASTIAVASPAAAQYYPQPQGYAYGYNNHGQTRRLLARVDQIRRQIERFDARDRISEREARDLRREANALRDRVRRASFNGLSFRERQAIEIRIARLEQRVQHELRDGNRWGSRDSRAIIWDRDRDGRDDRYEDDRGYDHD